VRELRTNFPKSRNKTVEKAVDYGDIAKKAGYNRRGERNLTDILQKKPYITAEKRRRLRTNFPKVEI